MRHHPRARGFTFPPLGALPLLTLVQARAAYGEQAVRWKVDSGRWQRIHHGIFVTHSGPIDWATRAGAAVLATSRPSTRLGDGGHSMSAGLMGWSAALVDGLSDVEPDVIGIVVPHGRRIAVPAGLHVVTSRRLTVRSEIWPPRTTIESTVIGLADEESDDVTLALIGRALQQRRTTMRRLRAELATWPRHGKRDLLEAVLADEADGCESALELRWFRDVERPHGIPAPTRQTPLVVRGQGRRFDLDWDDANLCVELDGLLFHTAATALTDRQKINALAGRRRSHLRYGWLEVTRSPCSIAAEVVATAQAQGARWPSRACRTPGCPVLRVTGY